MGAWQEQIEGHPFWDTLTEVESRIEEAEGIPEGNEVQAECLLRIGQIVGEARRRLTAVDPLLLAPGPLNNLHKHANQLLAELQAYSNAAPDKVKVANNHATRLLQVVQTQVPVPLTSDDAVALGESVTSFRRSVGQQKRHLDADLEQLSRKIEEAHSNATSLIQDLAAQKGRVDKFVTETKTQLDASEAQRSTTLQAAVAESNDRVESKLKTFGEQSQEAVSRLNSQISQQADQWQKESAQRQQEFSEQKEAWAKEAKEARKQSADAAKEILDQLDEHRKKAEEIVGIVAMTGMSGGYEKIADQHKDSAFRWSILAVLSLVLLVGFMVTTFFWSPTDFSWLALLRKVSVASVVVLLAAYSAQQASRNRARESRNRRYQLELASLDPFLASLKEERRNEVKAVLAERMFGVEEKALPESTTVSAKSVLDLARDIVKKIK